MATISPGIEQRGRGFYAVRDVPRPLQARVGRRRLVKSLETRDLRVAKARSHAAQADFQRQLDEAEREAVGLSPVVDAALAWRKTWQDIERGDPATLRSWTRAIIAHDPKILDQVPLQELAREAAQENFATELSETEETDPNAASILRGIGQGAATPIALYVDAWLSEGGTKGPLTDRTRAQYRSDLTALEKWLGAAGVATVEVVTKKIVGRYVSEALLATGMDRVTANRKISAPSSYWRWLMKRGHAEANPWVGQSLSKGADRGEAAPKKRPFTAGEMAALLGGSKLETDLELASAIRVAALSGMRLEEIYRLTVADCAGGSFNVRVSKTPAGRRRVPIHSELVQLVAGRVAGKAPGDFLFHEAGPAKPGRERSAPISKRFGNYRQAVKVHERGEGKRHSVVDFHSFRRWFITEARNAGADRAVVAAVVGHEAEGMTDGVYHGGPTEALKRAGVEAVRLPPLAAS